MENIEKDEAKVFEKLKKNGLPQATRMLISCEIPNDNLKDFFNNIFSNHMREIIEKGRISPVIYAQENWFWKSLNSESGKTTLDNMGRSPPKIERVATLLKDHDKPDIVIWLRRTKTKIKNEAIIKTHLTPLSRYLTILVDEVEFKKEIKQSVSTDFIFHLDLPASASDLFRRELMCKTENPGKKLQSILVVAQNTFESWWANQIETAWESIQRNLLYGQEDHPELFVTRDIFSTSFDTFEKHLLGMHSPFYLPPELKQLEPEYDLLTQRPFRTGRELEGSEFEKAKELSRVSHNDPMILQKLRDMFVEGLSREGILLITRLYAHTRERIPFISDEDMQNVCRRVMDECGTSTTGSSFLNQYKKLINQLLKLHFIMYDIKNDHFVIKPQTAVFGSTFASCVDNSINIFTESDAKETFGELEAVLREWDGNFKPDFKPNSIFSFYNELYLPHIKVGEKIARIQEIIDDLGDRLQRIMDDIFNRIAFHRKEFIVLIHQRRDLRQFQEMLEKDIDVFTKKINVYKDNIIDLTNFQESVQGNMEACESYCGTLFSKIHSVSDFLANHLNDDREKTSESLSCLANIDDTCHVIYQFITSFSQRLYEIVLNKERHVLHLIRNLTLLRKDSTFSKKLYRIWKLSVYDALKNPTSFKKRFGDIPFAASEKVRLVKMEVKGTPLKSFNFSKENILTQNEKVQKIQEERKVNQQLRKDADLQAAKYQEKEKVILSIISEIKERLLHEIRPVDLVDFIFNAFKECLNNHTCEDLDTTGTFLHVYQKIIDDLSLEQLSPVNREFTNPGTLLNFNEGQLRYIGPSYNPEGSKE